MIFFQILIAHLDFGNGASISRQKTFQNSSS